MDNSANDIFAGAAATPSEFLRGLAARAVDIKNTITAHEAMVSELKRELADILQKRMVDAMGEAGFTEMKLPDGWKFKIHPFVMGTLPKPTDDGDEEGKARRAAAIQWLEDNGAVNLIKTDLNVAFDKSQHNMALDAQQLLIERGLPATLASGVHPMSLQSWVKEALKTGVEVPLELLGLDAGQHVKITAPKEAL